MQSTPTVEKGKSGVAVWSPPTVKKAYWESLCGHLPKQGCCVIFLFQRMLSGPFEELIWRKGYVKGYVLNETHI